jgi:hypothetical protein
MSKICKKCNTEKLLTDFYYNKRTNKYFNSCISCEKVRSQLHYQNNKERHQARNKQWVEENKERHRQLVKNNRHKYSEYDKQYAKKYHKLNKHFQNLQNKKWREDNPDYYRDKRNNNIDFFREYARLYQNYKRKTDPQYRLKKSIQASLHFNLKKYNTEKIDTTVNYLGCKTSDYVVYIENLFFPEMNWENYGDIWEIDHILPISRFDFNIEEEIYKAFNYTNTQPLFKTTEIAKSFGYSDQIGNRNKYNNI